MNFLKKWKQRKAIARHVAGATVIHSGPFKNLKTPFETKALSQDFTLKWVAPFYLERIMDSDNYETAFLEVHEEINPQIIEQLLGYFDWRTRITGAYFASILDYKEFLDFIGIHLLKSEVCYAGEGYLVALASFNTPESLTYITKYLDYYLTRPDLWFDQGDAIAALTWLDKKNKTTLIEEHSYLLKWNDFISNKPNWRLDQYIDFFNRRMSKIEIIKGKLKSL
jgi:hypothetical protein